MNKKAFKSRKRRSTLRQCLHFHILGKGRSLHFVARYVVYIYYRGAKLSNTVKFYDDQARRSSKPAVVGKASRIVRLDLPVTREHGPVSSAALQAVAKSDGKRQTAVIASTIGAIAKATDAEISALHRRLDAFEASPTPKRLTAAERAEIAAFAARVEGGI